MKFILITLKQGLLCFAFTPALMLLLLILVLAGLVDADTEFPFILEAFLNWKYSADGLYLPFIAGVVVCLLSMTLIKTQPIPQHEKNKLAKSFNLFSGLASGVLFFWGGVYFAWSFGSVFINFISRVDAQELMTLLCVALAVMIRYGILKTKHFVLNKVTR